MSERKPILAIDPGTDESAWVWFDGPRRTIRDCGKFPNDSILHDLQNIANNADVAIEMIASYGMPVGREVFETCVWIGRFVEKFGGAKLVYRKDVKMHLCGNTKAKDLNIRQALLDLFPRTGGGKVPQIGTKKAPGPLYGVSGDVWAALGVAVYVADKTTGELT